MTLVLNRRLLPGLCRGPEPHPIYQFDGPEEGVPGRQKPLIPRYPFCSQVDGFLPQALTVNLRIVYQAAAQESPAADYFFRTMLFLVKVDRSRTKVDRSRIKVTFAGKQTTLVLTSQLLETIDFWQGRPGRQRQRARARRLAVCFEQCPSLPPANKHRWVNSIRLIHLLGSRARRG